MPGENGRAWNVKKAATSTEESQEDLNCRGLHALGNDRSVALLCFVLGVSMGLYKCAAVTEGS